MEKKGISQRVGLDAARNIELGSEFLNPIIFLLKGNRYKIGIDARLLNATNDVSKYHFPLLPIQVLISRNNGVVFSTTNLSNAYHQKLKKLFILSLEMNNIKTNEHFMD